MKVCVVGLRGLPRVMGGIEKHCEQIYPRIAALKSGVDMVITGRSPYLPSAHSKYQDVEVVSLWTLRHKYLETILHTFIAIFYARFVARADLVHIHAIGPGLFAPLARMLGMKVVVTHHGADYQRQKWSPFAKWLLRQGEAMAIAASHATIVVGATLCENLKQRYPGHQDKLLYIPNGADVGPRASTDKLSQHPILQHYGLEPGRYVLSVGRLVPEKGFQDLVQAVRAAQLPYPLVIAGASDHPDEFSRGLLQQQSEHTIFVGFQRGDALHALFANAALFVLASYHEGLPIAALEALSFGIPVVLSDIGPNLDVQLPVDCYFPVGNAPALASKLAAGSYEQYRVNTQQVLDQFDWDDIAERTLRLYLRIEAAPHIIRSA